MASDDDTQSEEGMALPFRILEDQPGAGTVTVKFDGVSAIVLKDGTLFGLSKGHQKRSYAKIQLLQPFRDIQTPIGYLIGADEGLLLESNVDFAPDPNPQDAVAAELERAADRAHDAVLEVA